MRRKYTMLPKENPTLRIWGYVLVVAMMWTIVVGVSLGSNLRQQRQETLEVARTAARTAYQKDVTYRRWNAGHSGVYVPITEETQPNPYLQDVAQRPINLIAFPSTSSGQAPSTGSGQAPSTSSGQAPSTGSGQAPSTGSGENEGLTLTLINPAYMTRQVHELAAELHGVKGHITSLDPIRPANAPDEWETVALQSFEEGKAEASEIQVIDGTSHMRLMRPLVTEESCLSCHAEQGYEVGEIRGGISVSIPMTSLEDAARKHDRVAWLGHGLLWVMGLAIIGGGGRALQGNVSKLKESEAQYRSLIQGIQAALIVHDADGRVVTSNPTAQRLLGLSEEQLHGKPTEDNRWCFLREDGTPMAVEDYPVNQVFATGQPVRELVAGIPRDEEDEIKWALIDADPAFNDAGEISQVIVTFMDITSRKQAEEALKHSEEQYALALRAANAGSWDWDITSNELEWSEQIEPLFGFERGEFEGTYEAFLQRVHPEDREFVTNAVNICLENNEDYAIEHRIVWPDGTVRWVAETGDVIRNNGGEPVRMLGVVQDITSRKRAEQEVRQQKDLLENTLESLTYPFFVVNVDDYTIQMANSAAIPPGDLPETLTCHALTHQCAEPCNTSEHPCPLQEVLSTREPVMMEHVHYDDDGNPRYVEVNGYPIFDAEGNIRQMIEYVIDVTERKLARKSLAEKKEALARSNAELEEFAYIASHDLQEPLRKVQAFGDRLKTRYGDALEDRGQDYLIRMQNAAERMRNLIDDLLTYSRVTTKAKPFETVDLNDVMEEVVADLVVRIEETDGQVEVGDLPTVKADAVQLRRLFLNLVGNALKFHKEDEPPVVKVYGEMPEHDDFEGKDIYQIAVEDNGIGFSEKYKEQIFAPFQRLHGRSKYEGTGMGLAICRKIVKRHGGRIWVESEPGIGTTFTFTLTVES